MKVKLIRPPGLVIRESSCLVIVCSKGERREFSRKIGNPHIVQEGEEKGNSSERVREISC